MGVVVVVGKVVVVVVVVEIDCEKPMKLETSPKVIKSKRTLHWCRSISKTYLCMFYYSISQKVITLSGRRFITVSGGFITLSGSFTLSGVFFYIIGQLLQYRAFITLSVGTEAIISSFMCRHCEGSRLYSLRFFYIMLTH